MSIANVLGELAKKYPERVPGSPDSSAVLSEIKEQTTSWDFQPTMNRISTYRYRMSIRFFAVFSFLAIGLSLVSPFWGFILAMLFWILLAIEPFSPTLAKLKPYQTDTATITIPARSKETQKIAFIANYATDNFISGIGKLSNLQFIAGVISVGLLQTILLAINLFIPINGVLPYLLIFPASIFLITFLIRESKNSFNNLSSCAALLELGSILLKARSNTTTVILNFCGTNSLHSGMLNIAKVFNKTPGINYAVHLVDWPDKRMNIVASDGLLFPQKTDPVLMDIMMDVAKEKSIPLQTIQSKEFSNTYLLKLKKVNAVTITNPFETADSEKLLRELLIGLIRKVEH